MNRSRITRTPYRSPGEIAFDRCFFPLATLFVLGVVIVALTLAFAPLAHPRSEIDFAPGTRARARPLWPSRGAGLIIAFFWWRGFVSVARAWRDPSARVLRFSALGLLIPLAIVAVRFLHLPFF